MFYRILLTCVDILRYIKRSRYNVCCERVLYYIPKFKLDLYKCTRKFDNNLRLSRSLVHSHSHYFAGSKTTDFVLPHDFLRRNTTITFSRIQNNIPQNYQSKISHEILKACSIHSTFPTKESR